MRVAKCAGGAGAVGGDVLHLPPREPKLHRQRNTQREKEDQGEPGKGVRHATLERTSDMRE
jgi:hypothetical protein